MNLNKTIAGTFAAAALLSSPVTAQTYLPSDPDATCTVSQSDVAQWFVSKQITANGAVNPADSVDFPVNNTICDF